MARDNRYGAAAVSDNSAGAPGLTRAKRLRTMAAPFEGNRSGQSSTGRFPAAGIKPENNEPIPASELLKRPLGEGTSAMRENVDVLRRPLGETPTTGGAAAPMQNSKAPVGYGAGAAPAGLNGAPVAKRIAKRRTTGGAAAPMQNSKAPVGYGAGAAPAGLNGAPVAKRRTTGGASR